MSDDEGPFFLTPHDKWDEARAKRVERHLNWMYKRWCDYVMGCFLAGVKPLPIEDWAKSGPN